MSEVQENPYAPGVVQKKHVHSEVEAIRHKHLSHEASIKSVGFLYLLGGAIGLLIGTSYVIPGISIMSSPQRMGQMSMQSYGAVFMIVGVIVFLLGVAQMAVGSGFRRLALWSKIPGAILAGIGMLLFPIGTLINGYVLYLLLSAKGSMVFSPEYKEVIFQTPHMKYKTSIVVWVFVGLLALLFVIAIVAALFNA
jgi:hypothetical protein